MVSASVSVSLVVLFLLQILTVFCGLELTLCRGSLLMQARPLPVERRRRTTQDAGKSNVSSFFSPHTCFRRSSSGKSLSMCPFSSSSSSLPKHSSTFVNAPYRSMAAHTHPGLSVAGAVVRDDHSPLQLCTCARRTKEMTLSWHRAKK